MHKAIDDAVSLILCHVGQVCVDGCGFRRHVAKVGLNEPEIDAKFYQMGGV